MRWGPLLGHLPSDYQPPRDAPMTAFASGPVLTFGAVKPRDELPELLSEDEMEEAEREEREGG
jgi:hypothetical protein